MMVTTDSLTLVLLVGSVAFGSYLASNGSKMPSLVNFFKSLATRRLVTLLFAVLVFANTYLGHTYSIGWATAVTVGTTALAIYAIHASVKRINARKQAQNLS